MPGANCRVWLNLYIEKHTFMFDNLGNNLIRYPFPAGVPHLDDLETIGLVQSVGLYLALFSVIVVVGYLTYMLYKVNMTSFFLLILIADLDIMIFLYSQVYSAGIRHTMLLFYFSL